jgi:hypothetical protein
VPIAHPQLGLARKLAHDAVVHLDGALVFADRTEDGCLQAAVTGIAGLGLEQSLDLLERGRVLALADESRGVVVAGAFEARRQFETARQQVFGIQIATQSPGHFREHADGGDVGGMVLEMPPEQGFSLRNAVVAQSRSRRDQARVAYRGPEEARPGALGTRLIAGRRQVIRERSPGVRHVRIELRGAPQLAHGILPAAERPEGTTQLEVRRSPAWLFPDQALEHGVGRRGLAAQPLGDAEQH